MSREIDLLAGSSTQALIALVDLLAGSSTQALIALFAIVQIPEWSLPDAKLPHDCIEVPRPKLQIVNLLIPAWRQIDHPKQNPLMKKDWPTTG